MSELRRFFSLGAQEIDRRVGAALTRPRLDGADRYLRESTIARAIDRVTTTLAMAWSQSRSVATCTALLTARHDWVDSFQSIGVPLAVAVLVHVLLTLMQGARPGWFWLVVPALTAFFAAVLLAAVSAGKRSAGRSS